MNEKLIIKRMKKKGGLSLLIAAAICLAAAITMILLGSFVEENALYIGDVTGENQVAYAKTDMISDAFAVREKSGESTSGYHLAADSEYYIIIEMDSNPSAENKNYMDNFYGEYDGDEPLKEKKFWGSAHKVPEQLKEYAISALNEMYGTDGFSVDDFEYYFYDYYINIENSGHSGALYLGGFFALVLSGIFIILSIVKAVQNSIRIKGFKRTEDYKNLKEEISGGFVNSYCSGMIWATNKSIIAPKSRKVYTSFKDIAWIYLIPTSQELRMVTLDGVTELLLYSKKYLDDVEFKKIIEEIKAKAPWVLLGYTNENISKMSPGMISETLSQIRENRDGIIFEQSFQNQTGSFYE